LVTAIVNELKTIASKVKAACTSLKVSFREVKTARTTL
jgi:hypothetical protein